MLNLSFYCNTCSKPAPAPAGRLCIGRNELLRLWPLRLRRRRCGHGHARTLGCLRRGVLWVEWCIALGWIVARIDVKARVAVVKHQAAITHLLPTRWLFTIPHAIVLALRVFANLSGIAMLNCRDVATWGGGAAHLDAHDLVVGIHLQTFLFRDTSLFVNKIAYFSVLKFSSGRYHPVTVPRRLCRI